MQVNPSSANNFQSADQIYTDLNGLQSIRQLGKQDKNAALMEVAKQFESMFMNMMLTSMRQAGAAFSEDSLLNSPESQFYQGMYDQQMALSLSSQGGDNSSGSSKSSGGGVGLADVIYRQLMSNYGTDPDSAPELDQSQLFDRRVTSLPALKDIEAKQLESKELADTRQNVERLLVPESQSTEEVSSDMTSEEASQSESLTSASNESLSDGSYSTGNQSNGHKGQAFSSPREFVAALYPHAEKVAEELGVDAKAIVAQAALETGWGKHMIRDDSGQNSFNFFGIKADGRWQGDSVQVTTHEFRNGVMMKENARFRSYASLEDGLRDYADFLTSGSRYQQAIGNDLDASQYGHALQKAGYATDPEYGNKIARIARSDWFSDIQQQAGLQPKQPDAQPSGNED
ncbi:MAG: flagellar assembly peptidoglycan hydrolase FlgJ [Oceanobacter sp.]